MPNSTWRPGNLKRKRALEPALEDVPNHLVDPLSQWLQSQMNRSSPYTYAGRLQSLALELGVSINSPFDSTFHAWNSLSEALARKPTSLLDGIEWVLGCRFPGYDPKAADLELILSQGHSAYRVAPDGSKLEMRVDPSVRGQVQEAVDSSSGSSGDHLAEAFAKAYGVKTDPSKAYGESIKAVEAAAAPVVSPQNPKATLGTIISAITDKKTKWEFESGGEADGVDTTVQMMRLLWSGQTSRHGGIALTRVETLPEAQAAVNLASTLVQWCSTGIFRLR